MSNHLIFPLYLIFFIISTIGYGYMFSNYFNNNFLKFNIGYQGLIGFFFITFISIITSFFFKHGFLHNSIIHLIGCASFLIYLKKKTLKIDELKELFIIFLLLISALYIFKNHDDFSYYHLTYSLNLTENKFIVGTGNFSHGFRTFSSIFYYHSILYMPFIKYYLFHSGPLIILIFVNSMLISKIIYFAKEKDLNFVYFFSLLSLAFANIIFYRIGEHGTDRSAQILLLLIFIFLFEIKFLNLEKKAKKDLIYLMMLIIIFTASLKAIYILYLVLIPVALYGIKDFKYYFLSIKYKFLLILFFAGTSILLVNFLSTGCLLYPAKSTCTTKVIWHIPQNEVKKMNIHYEWWAKAGGGPNYKSKLKKEEYIKDFNWVKNWIDKHFFNKVSDTLLGILAICLIFSSFFLKIKKRKKRKYKTFDIYLIIIFFLTVWFIKHPAMRYGGFVLISLPFFTFISGYLGSHTYKNSKIFLTTNLMIFIIFLTFNGRNIVRLNKEIDFYKYDIQQSPLFYVEKIQSEITHTNKNFKIYSPLGGSCWDSKTPCSYNRNLDSYKKLGFNIVFRKDE